ncbi:MAG: hypothetical protein WCR30_00665 [Clostridia bacterium]
MNKVFANELMVSIYSIIGKKNKESKLLDDFINRIPQFVLNKINNFEPCVELCNWKASAIVKGAYNINVSNSCQDKNKNKISTNLELNGYLARSLIALKEKNSNPKQLNLACLKINKQFIDGKIFTYTYNWNLGFDKNKFKIIFDKNKVKAKNLDKSLAD